jgi:hypothetical protein
MDTLFIAVLLFGPVCAPNDLRTMGFNLEVLMRQVLQGHDGIFYTLGTIFGSFTTRLHISAFLQGFHLVLDGLATTVA